MSAQESTIAVLQQQLHAANIERFQKIEDRLDTFQQTMEKVVANTADLPQLKEKIASIDAERNKFKGAAKLGVLLGGGSMVGEALRWFWFKH